MHKIVIRNLTGEDYNLTTSVVDYDVMTNNLAPLAPAYQVSKDRTVLFEKSHEAEQMAFKLGQTFSNNKNPAANKTYSVVKLEDSVNVEEEINKILHQLQKLPGSCLLLGDILATIEISSGMVEKNRETLDRIIDIYQKANARQSTLSQFWRGLANSKSPEKAA